MYADLANTAADLIEQYGQPATLRHVTSTGNAVTGFVDVSVDYPVDVLEKDIDSVAQFASSLASGSLVAEATRSFNLVGHVPAIGDRLIIGTATYVIEAVRPFSPGATVIYYTVRVKA